MNTQSHARPGFKAYLQPRVLVMLALGFSSGLPLALTGVTLQAWMSTKGIDLSVIGVFAVVGLPYTLKFLWSPLMDRFVPPFLGRRRGWILICQLALILFISAMAMFGVTMNLLALGAIALLVAFFSASQDIAVDAYRTEILWPHELGAGSGLYIMGYRLGYICSSAITLMLAHRLSWPQVYLLMAGGMLVGVVTVLRAPEPSTDSRPRTLAQAVVQPFLEFMRRRGAMEMLLFILIYKLDWAMVQAMMTPFMVSTGFSTFEIGAVSNGFGMVATIVGAMIGAAVITRIGIHRSLWVFGLLQGLAGSSFTALALLGKNHVMMVAAITAESVCAGMATSAFTGFIMSLCDKRFTATQFALLTSLMALGRVLIGIPAGWFSKEVGWTTYFVVSTLIAIPGLLLLLGYNSWQKVVEEEPIDAAGGSGR